MDSQTRPRRLEVRSQPYPSTVPPARTCMHHRSVQSLEWATRGAAVDAEGGREGEAWHRLINSCPLRPPHPRCEVSGQHRPVRLSHLPS